MLLQTHDLPLPQNMWPSDLCTVDACFVNRVTLDKH